MKTGCIQSNNLKHKVFFSSRPILMSEKRKQMGIICFNNKLSCILMLFIGIATYISNMSSLISCM